MRILHVTDVYRPRVGGIEMFVEELALRQAAAGHEVTVLTGTGTGAPSGTGAPTDTGPLRVVRAPAGGYVPLLSLPIVPSDYDVVHAHLSVVSVFATRVAKAAARGGTPVVNTVHSMWNGREGWVRIVRDLAAWDRLPQVWTSVSGAAAAAVGEVLHPAEQVHVVPNAVDVDWWRGRPDPRRDPVLTLVSVMRLAGRKRPLQLIDMLAGLGGAREPAPGLRGIIVGEGPLESRVSERIAELGLAGWIELRGPRSREEIREIYRSADLYVAPSHQESFGLAALEARAAGLPVVAMRSGGVGEFVRDGVEGVLCEDDADMGHALAGLAAEPSRLDRIAAYNRQHRPVHDWSLTLDGFDEVYELARGAARTPRSQRVGG